MAESGAIPFGAWPSPITAETVARARLRLDFPFAADGRVWWQESRPEGGGRTTVMLSEGAAEPRALLAAPWDACTRVHEYGGRSYLPVRQDGGWALVFSHRGDQRLWVAGQDGGEPRPLTPEPDGPAALRYADLAVSADGTEVWCVREAHGPQGSIARAIVAVPLDGSAAGRPAAVRVLAEGSDFLAFPTPSPDGRHLAWIGWDHPALPWDAAELRVGRVDGAVPTKGWAVLGGPEESVQAPCWDGPDRLRAVSDRSGWWNLYEVDPRGDRPPRALHPAAEEFGYPLWDLGGRPFVPLPDGQLAVVHGAGDQRLGVLDPRTGQLADVAGPFTVFESALAADGTAVVAVAAAPDRCRSIVRFDLTTGRTEVLRSELPALPDAGYLPRPRALTFAGAGGEPVHAYDFPPTHPEARAPEGERPPYVVWVHGGPTGHEVGALDLSKAYFTSRGIGVIAVNYGGSSGYGRAHRERLKGQWGVVDVADVVTAARLLAASGAADGARLAVRGPSAGGWTALAAVTTGLAAHGPVFRAATSYFGVTDLELLAAELHDFESRLLDGLVGPLPETAALYRERSPLGHVGPDTCPVLLLQGTEDPVVPQSQAEHLARELEAKGVGYELLVFEGESHGFRKAETVIAALGAELGFYARALGFEPAGAPAEPWRGHDQKLL